MQQRWTLFTPHNQLFTPTAHELIYSENDPEFHYAIRVLRLQENTEICVTDGQGQSANGVLSAISKKSMSVRILALKGYVRPHFSIHVALALPKTAVLDGVLSSAAELGVAGVWLFKGLRSQFSQPISSERLSRYSAVMKESLRINKSPFLPTLVFDTPENIHQRLLGAVHCVCDEQQGDQQHLFDHLKSRVLQPKPCVLWIGPESGWSPEERALFKHLEIASVSLGPLIFRVPQAVASGIVTAQTYSQHVFSSPSFSGD